MNSNLMGCDVSFDKQVTLLAQLIPKHLFLNFLISGFYEFENTQGSGAVTSINIVGLQ